MGVFSLEATESCVPPQTGFLDRLGRSSDPLHGLDVPLLVDELVIKSLQTGNDLKHAGQRGLRSGAEGHRLVRLSYCS